MNIFEESVFSKMDNLIQDFYRSADKVIKNFKSTGKDGKRGKTPAGHC